jgi:hypothetical protein
VAHDYHEGLEGYDARQILHDHCVECEARGKDLTMALAHMDDERFARAWKRAFDWLGSNGDHNAVGPVAFAEVELLNVLWGIQVIFERFGVPLDGQVPGVAARRWVLRADGELQRQREESLRQASAATEKERWREHDEGTDG